MSSVNNIEAMRVARGWSRPVLGQRMGTSGQQIERLEKGQRKLTQEWIDKAADAFGVSSHDIITPGAVPDAASVTSRAITPRADQQPTRSVDGGETGVVAKLDLRLPMGPGATVDDYVEDEPVTFDLAYIRSFSRAPLSRLRLAEGVGDSMWPTLVSADLVWIDTTQNQLLHSDRIYAASINGGAAIKRLRPVDGGKRVLIISDNKTVDSYEVDAKDVAIWGRVIPVYERPMIGRVLICLLLSSLFSPPARAQAADVRSRQYVKKIDVAFRNFGDACHSLGFTRTAAGAPEEVQKRMFAYLLLKSQFEADEIIVRWAGYVTTMTQLGDAALVKAISARAGDALAAAELDPSTYDQAKKMYVDAFTSPFKDIHEACTAAVADSFLRGNYVSGSGSLAATISEAESGFDEAMQASHGKK